MLEHRHHAVTLAASFVAASLGAQTLRIEPRTALADAPVRIAAVGLQPHASVVIRAHRQDAAGNAWESTATLTADERGTVDLSRQSPTAAAYDGVRPMGLITTMDVSGESRGRVRYQFAWSDTMRTAISLEQGGRVVSVDTLVQTFSAPGVRVRPIREGGLLGTLFTPATTGKAPGLLVLGGSEGGLSSEDMAAVLASHGYAALALAYFGLDALPPALDQIPLEYFDRAIDLLQNDIGVLAGGVGIVGTSKGAEAALIVAASSARVRAVVGYLPSSVVWSCICGQQHSSWTRGGVGVTPMPTGTNPDYHPAPGTPIRPVENYVYRFRDSVAAARAEIPVDQIHGPLLLIAGDDDGLWPSLPMARAIIARRKRTSVSEGDLLLSYAGAGHLIGKAYVPAGSTVVGGGRLETGGSVNANALAQADSWPRVLAFLRSAMTGSGVK